MQLVMNCSKSNMAHLHFFYIIYLLIDLTVKLIPKKLYAHATAPASSSMSFLKIIGGLNIYFDLGTICVCVC